MTDLNNNDIEMQIKNTFAFKRLRKPLDRLQESIFYNLFRHFLSSYNQPACIENQ